MTSSALRGSPEEVLAAAGRLGRDGALLRDLGGRWGSRAAALGGGAGWTGAASLVASARCAQLATEFRAGADGMARVESGARSYGATLGTSQDAVRSLLTRREAAEGDLVIILRLPRPDPDPLIEVRLERRIAELRREIAALRAEIEQEESLLDVARERFADLLDWRPGPVVQDLLDLASDIPGIARLPKFTADLATGMVTAFHTVRALLSTTVDDYLTRAGQALRWVQRMLPKVGRLPFWRWVKNPALEVLASVGGLISGGGYEGLRGVTHRVLSGVGVIGGIAIVGGLVLGAPLAVPLGTAAIAISGVWRIGNLAWDHRDKIGKVVRGGLSTITRFGAWLFGLDGPKTGTGRRSSSRRVRPLPPPVRDDGFAPPSVRRPPCGNDRPIPLLRPIRDVTCDWGPWRRPGPPPAHWVWPWVGLLRVPLLPVLDHLGKRP